jgi:hypothetical protein
MLDVEHAFNPILHVLPLDLEGLLQGRPADPATFSASVVGPA